MRELETFLRQGVTIIEHETEVARRSAIGSIEYGELRHDSVVIGWHEHSGGSRTTTFYAVSWKCEVVGNVAFLRRINADEVGADLPPRDVRLYVLVKK